MKKGKIVRMVGIALMMAIVVVLQLMGSFVKVGPVSFALTLIPIVVGAAMYGPIAGAILGATFSVVVLLDPTTAAFYGISVFGTVVTVLVKGTAAGFLAGVVFRALEKKHQVLGVALAAAVCPLVNTGLFLVGCRLFFWETLGEWSGGGNTLMYAITVMIGINSIAELCANVICAPVILRIVNAAKHQ